MGSPEAAQYFSDNINKTLLCHVPPRPTRIISRENTYDAVENFLNQTEFTINLSRETEFMEILRKIDELYTLRQKNIICRAYLEISLYVVPKKYFGLIEFKEIILVLKKKKKNSKK